MSLRATERSVAIDLKGRCEGEARGNLVMNYEIASLRSQ
ncbi:hypothetical protein ES706_04118 [subsurface metagenome]